VEKKKDEKTGKSAKNQKSGDKHNIVDS